MANNQREYAGGSRGASILRKSNFTAASGSSSGSVGAYTHNQSSGNSGGIGGPVNPGDARQVDLLVFGYACKMFRDDAKAREIDQGKHLINWMGDDSLKIDRYDVRGALSDLAPYEAPPGGYGNRLKYLSAEEQRAEQLCEEERYLFLYNNEEALIQLQEEEWKRLQQEVNGSDYSQVNFQYDEASGCQQYGPNREDPNGASQNSDDVDEPFVLPKNFVVPITIKLPDTMKQHIIIEKTARFIAAHGAQMEILIKAKQSNNVQFEFLTQNGLLNPYYKFILNAMKMGTYPSEAETGNAHATSSESKVSNPDTVDSNTSSMSFTTKPIITVPTIKYKPSANCAYTQLISKIKGVPLPAVLDENARADFGTSSPITVSGNGADFTPVLLQYNGNTFVRADGEEEALSKSGIKSNSNSGSDSKLNSNSQDAPSNQVKVLINSSALALAQNYASDSEEDEEEQPKKAAEPPKPEPVLNFPIPGENLKNIIDKTAVYVIKNGRQFEETLRSKSIERFNFLLPENEHYPYYMYKITGDPDAASKEQKTRRAAAVAAALLSKKGIIGDKSISPVSFSIRPKDELAAFLQPALPQDASDDEEDAQKVQSAGPRSVPEEVRRAIKLVESQLMAKTAQTSSTIIGPSLPPVSTVPAVVVSNPRSRFDLDYNVTLPVQHANSHNNTTFKDVPTTSESDRNALYEQQQQARQKELKKAEEKVKDKLAQIAREKLGGLISKEKQLQLERKRKAMAFLHQIQDPEPSTDAKAAKKSANADTTDDVGNTSDNSETSVHSIPITSYGPDDDDCEDVSMTAQTNLKSSTPPTIIQPKEKEKPAKDGTTMSTTTTVLLSDDDDVQVVSELKASKSFASSSSRQYHSLKNAKVAHKRHREHTPSTKGQSTRHYRLVSTDSSSSSSSTTSTSSSTTSTSSSSTTPERTRTEKRVRRKHHHQDRSKSRSSLDVKVKKSFTSSSKRKYKSNYKQSHSRSPSHSGSRSSFNYHQRHSEQYYTDDHQRSSRSHNARRLSTCSEGSTAMSSNDEERRRRYCERHHREESTPRSSSSSKHKSKNRKRDRYH